VDQNDRGPFAAGGRARQKAINDFFAAALRSVHRDDSLSHVVAFGRAPIVGEMIATKSN
jgi:hypothetical protein